LWQPPHERPTTGPDGRFHFTVSKAHYGDWWTVVTASAASYGPGWVVVPADGKRDDLTLRLVADDVPIPGPIVDLEGKPIAGPAPGVQQMDAAPGDDLGPWLEAVKGKTGRSFDLEKQYLNRTTDAVSPQATTDAEGRFRLTGIGRNRLARLRLEGPGIAIQELHVLTRAGKSLEVTRYEGRPEYGEPRMVTTYYGASFQHVTAPDRPIVGVVRDKDTKKPLAGVSIRSFKEANDPIHHLSDGQEIVRTTTDAQGRYRLTGMPKGDGNKIKVLLPDNLPYLAVSADVPNSAGLGAVTLDLELKRGVWIEGKITDKVTGKPLKAGVEYLPLYANPNQRDFLEVYRLFHHGTVKEDGSYRIVGMPGPGMVAVYSQKDHYLRVDQRQDEFGSKGLTEDEYPGRLRGSNCGALARVNPAKGAVSVKRDVTLDPGWRLTGTVLDSDGKPLAGTRSF